MGAWVIFMAHMNNTDAGEPIEPAAFVYLTPGRTALAPSSSRSVETFTAGRNAPTLTGERLK